MTSPPPRVPRDHHVELLMLFFRNRTLPSTNRAFTPPGWLLRLVYIPLDGGSLTQSALLEFGVRSMLKSGPCAIRPMIQQQWAKSLTVAAIGLFDRSALQMPMYFWRL